MREVQTPSWAQQVLDEHRELREKVAELQEFLKRPRPEPGESGAHTWAAALSRRLVKLHDELVRHFRFEDEGGMAEDIARRHPRAANAIDEIVGEHPALLRRVRRLMNVTLTYSEGRRPEDPSLRRRVAELLDRLERHERAETEMIHRLACDDIGIGD